MMQKTEERRSITILFADLSGFTALSHKLDPEDAREVANTCFEYLNQPIIKEEGTIHKYEGDLVIALFGFPVAHEDDPERAIKASLKMMGLVPEINETLSSRLKVKTELGLHIGINSGTVVVGEVGSKEKKEYTIMGDAVNLASRLKDNAKRGEIIVSEPVFKASRYLFDYEALPPVSLKGIEEPFQIFKPLKIKDKPDPKRGIQGLYSPLVGRDRELESLKQWFKKLEKGKFGAAFILGDAGLGKSRLYEELKKYLQSTSAQGHQNTGNVIPAKAEIQITILEGRCLSYGDAIPYSPFLQIIKQIFGIVDSDSPKIIQEKLLKKARHLFSDDYKEVVPYLGYLFAIRFPDELDEKIKYLEPKDLKIQIFISVRKLLSRIQPVLIAIDDCHWIDPESLELIEFIFDAPEPFPLFFLGLARIEKEKPWYKTKENLKKRLGGDYLEIILEPLDMNSSAQLIENLLKVPGFSEEFRDKIQTKAEGNPFYLEEILRSFIDSGILVFKEGVWSLSNINHQLSTVFIPDTVQAVITSRLDRLPQDAREILQMASVMGRSFYVRILECIGGFDELMLILHLATLEEFEYIKKVESQKLEKATSELQSPISNLQSEIEYIFRHPLVQEVAYNSLSKKRRKELHRKTGEAIEKIFHNRLDDFTEILAHQYLNSDDTEKAIEWQKKAGQKAKERYANDKAIEYFERVISIIKQVGAIHELPLIDAYEALGDVYNLKAEYAEAIKNYQEMFDNAKDKIVRARARRRMADVCQSQGRYDDALRILDSAEQILRGDSVDEIIEKSEIYLLRCWILRVKGEMDNALKQGETGLSIVGAIQESSIDEKRIKRIKAEAFNNLGAIFYYKGDYDRAVELYQKYLKISEEIGDKRSIGVASCNLGNVYRYKGDYDRAVELYQKDLKISEEIGDKQGIGMASGNLGNVYYYKSDYDRAVELYQKHLKIFEEIGYKQGIGMASGNLGNVYLDKGDYDRAVEFFQKHLKISEEIGDKRSIGVASCNLGGLFLEIGEIVKAEEFLLKSKEISEEVGLKDILIEVYCYLSELLTKKGEKFKNAYEYANMGLRLTEETDSKPDRAKCYSAFGKIYAKEVGSGKSEVRSKEWQEKLKLAEENFKKAMEIYKELKEKKSLADCYLEYARMLKNLRVGELENLGVKETSEIYLNKALEIYKELKLPHRIKEVEELKSHTV